MMTVIARGKGVKMALGALLAGLALASGGAAVRGQEPGRPALLFIITGQSNAGQQGKAGQLPPALAGGVEGAWYYAPQATKQRRLLPLAAYRGAFGVELSLAQAIRAACPGREIVVAKVYSGGTSLFAWDPLAPGRPGWRADMQRVGNATKPAMYPRVLATVAAAAAAYGAPAEVSGVFYIQTERDSKMEWGAQNYERNLRALIAAWRDEWNAPALPVVLMDSHTNLNGGGPLVHEAVVAVTGTTPATGWAAVRDLPTKDGIHFNSEGVIALGERLAAEWLRLAGGCE